MMVLEVRGMTCSGCTGAVERVVRRIAGVRDVRVTLEGGRVEIDGDPDRAAVEAAIRKAGYEVAAA